MLLMKQTHLIRKNQEWHPRGAQTRLGGLQELTRNLLHLEHRHGIPIDPTIN
jgi:hypothetical protein